MGKSFEDTLKKIMMENNISSKAIASITGMSKGAVSQILNGKKENQKCNVSKPNYTFLKNILWNLELSFQEKEELFDSFSKSYNLLPEGMIEDSIYAKIILCAIKEFSIHGMFYSSDKESFDNQFNKLVNKEIELCQKKEFIVISMAELDQQKKSQGKY